MEAPEIQNPLHLTSKDLLGLLEEGAPPCVSIFLPTHRQTPHTDQDQIRLRKLLSAARHDLDELGLKTREQSRILGQASQLVDDAFFWRTQDAGLSLLLTSQVSHIMKVPIPVPELAITGERFHLHPLAELLRDNRGLVLALSQHQVRLFEFSQWAIQEIEVPDLPQSVEESVGQPAGGGNVQVRRAAAGPSEAAFFHGHGGAKDAAAEHRLHFLRDVDEAIADIVNSRRLPLVLAGVKSLIAEFRSANPARSISGEIPGNPDEVSPRNLRDAGWQLLAPLFAQEGRQVVERFEQLSSRHQTSTDIRELTSLAGQGLVDQLLLRPAVETSTLSRETLTRLDDAFVHTLQFGGSVHLLEQDQLDAEVPAAGILRH